MEGKTTIKQCPNCRGAFDDVRRLNCNHLICHSCTTKCTTGKEDAHFVSCPFKNCLLETAIDDVQPLPPYASKQRKRRKKAMEDDLLETAKEMGLSISGDEDGFYDVSDDDWPLPCGDDCGHLQRNDDMKSESRIETEMKNIKIQSTSDNQLKPKTRDETRKSCDDSDDESDDDSGVMSLLYKLSNIAKNCASIRAFSPNKTCEKLMVDIVNGEKTTAEEFLKKHFPEDFEAKRLVIVAQNSPGHFLVNIGTKIANGKLDTVRHLIGQPSECLRSGNCFGTVTCLAEDIGANGQLYLLTSNHIMKKAEQETSHDGRSDTGRFISSYHNKLEEVSDHYDGIFGPVRFHRIFYNIDIAALKITDGMQSKMNDQDCACRMQELRNIYKGKGDNLLGAFVSKNGAATGVTCGKIINTFYCLKYEPHLDAGRGFLVKSLDDDQPFAKPGDSGALVWNHKGDPIGIVSYQIDEYLVYGEHQIKATYVVLLHHCITALKRCGYINDIKCKTHGAAVPVVSEDTSPPTALHTDRTPQST